MADIRAFRGFRYDLGRAGALSDLVAPPYDVVDPALQQALYDRSPYNAIRLELTRDEPGDTPTRNRYTRAAQTLSGWQNDHVLQQDTLRHALRRRAGVHGRGDDVSPPRVHRPASAWSRSAPAASSRTRRRCPARRKTGSSCSAPPA